MTRKHKTRKHKTRKHKTRKHKGGANFFSLFKNKPPAIKIVNIPDFDIDVINPETSQVVNPATYFDTEKRKIELALIRDAIEFNPIINYDLMQAFYNCYEQFKKFNDIRFNKEIEGVFKNMGNVYKKIHSLLEYEISVIKKHPSEPIVDPAEPIVDTSEPIVDTSEPIVNPEKAYTQMKEMYTAAIEKKQIHKEAIDNYDCVFNSELFSTIMTGRKGIIEKLNSELSNVYIALFNILKNKGIAIKNTNEYEANKFKLAFSYKSQSDHVVDVLTEFIEKTYQNLSYKLNPAIYADIMKILNQPIDSFFKNLKVVKKFWDGKTKICNKLNDGIVYQKSYIDDGNTHTHNESYFLYYGEIKNNDESNYIIFYNKIQNDLEKSKSLNYKYFSHWFLNYIFDEKNKSDFKGDFDIEKQKFKTYLEEKQYNTELRDALNNNTGIFIIDTTNLNFDKDNKDIKFNFYPDQSSSE
jgi:hypothetical protein